MSDNKKIYVSSSPLPAARSGVLTRFDPGIRTLKAGFQIAPLFQPLPVDVVLEKDIALTLRDGVTVYVDVFRPVGEEKVPVIVAYSPYGKGQGTSPSVMGIFGLVGLNNSIVSGLEKFEGPDPAFWCAQGYAICNPDMRGVIDSDGDSVLWDRQEGRDCYDLIEWLAEQEWCDGKVAMSGTSYLAATQWFTAAEQPPHLAAINPWEGVSDVYRDLVMRGGMPDTGFARQLQEGSFFGKGRKEDILAEVEQYPLFNDLWEHKSADFDRIEAPAYVVASYSNTLHTAGTFRGWRRMASKEKWLRIHNSQEWPDYYDEANRADLLRFFDHYLKGKENGWEQTPRVRYSVLDLEGGDRINIPADQFPPNDITPTKFYLNGRSRVLTTEAPADEVPATYTVGANPSAVSFITRFERETVLVGYPKAHLWVEAQGADDMDLFVLVQKLDEHGTPLEAFTVPNHSAMVYDVTDHGASILKYKGSDGRLRVSLRRLDKDATTDQVPVHSFDHVEKLAPGEIAEIEIELLPIGLAFHPGEQLRFIVSSRNLLGTMMPGIHEYVGANEGQHIIHTGGEYASYLQLPVKTDTDTPPGRTAMDDLMKLQTLWDERAITATMLRFAHSLDIEDWEAHASCFTDPVNIDFSRFTGMDEIRVSPELWARFARFILADAPRHHLLGTFQITIKGDHAWATVDMISSLWTSSDSGYAANRQYGWFDVSFTREGDEWKISRIRHDYQGVDGNAAKLENHDPAFAALAQEVFSPANMEAARTYLEQNGKTRH